MISEYEYYCKQIGEIDEDITIGVICEFCRQEVISVNPAPDYCPDKDYWVERHEELEELSLKLLNKIG